MVGEGKKKGRGFAAAERRTSERHITTHGTLVFFATHNALWNDIEGHTRDWILFDVLAILLARQQVFTRNAPGNHHSRAFFLLLAFILPLFLLLPALSTTWTSHFHPVYRYYFFLC
jgi:hypothetical protein